MFGHLEQSTIISIFAIIISLISLVSQITSNILEKSERLKIECNISNRYLAGLNQIMPYGQALNFRIVNFSYYPVYVDEIEIYKVFTKNRTHLFSPELKLPIKIEARGSADISVTYDHNNWGKYKGKKILFVAKTSTCKRFKSNKVKII